MSWQICNRPFFFWLMYQEAGRREMESLRDVKRAMEREVKKGAARLGLTGWNSASTLFRPSPQKKS